MHYTYCGRAIAVGTVNNLLHRISTAQWDSGRRGSVAAGQLAGNVLRPYQLARLSNQPRSRKRDKKGSEIPVVLRSSRFTRLLSPSLRQEPIVPLLQPESLDYPVSPRGILHLLAFSAVHCFLF